MLPDPQLPDPQQPDGEQLLAAALSLARHGYPVFPCVPGEKRPLTRHGLYDATLDSSLIRVWWRRWPTANLALPTGIPTRVPTSMPTGASFDVLDVDVHDSGSGYPALDRLTRAGLLDGFSHVVTTPHRGLHVYFPGTRQPSARRPRLHLDVKATGGYVLTPPSVVDGRRYELVRRTEGPHRARDWAVVLDLFDPPDPRSKPQRIGREPSGAGIDALVRWVARLPEGRRNDGTFWATCRAIEQGCTDLRPLVEAAVAAGLPYPEAARTVASARRRAAC